MDQPPPVTSSPRTAPADVQRAIARAAERTGVDFQYLLGQARLESSLNPDARAGTSSAAGLYQFTRGTWLRTLDRHGADHGFGWAGGLIDGSRVADPDMRQQLLDLRYDPQLSALMAAELAGDNADHLQRSLGRAPDAAELYLAHFLGADGAGRFLKALATDPHQSVADLFPDAAAANRALFYDGTAARSVGDLMLMLRAKLARAMETSSTGADQSANSGAWAVSPTAVHAAPGSLPAGRPAAWAERPQRASMADTLRMTFAATDPAAPARVRDAYAKLKAFDL